MNFKSTIVALAAMPSAVSSWSIGPSYYTTTPLRVIETTTPMERMLQKQRMIAQRMFDQQSRPSHRYELIDNEEKFQLTVDVPGVNEEDIDIKLDDGRLTVKGQRVAASDSSRFTSKFSQTFSLDPTVDVESFTATLNNGVLVVSAPKDLAKLEENVRKIHITPLEEILAEADQNEETQNEEESSSDEQDEKEVDIPVDSADSSPTDSNNDTPDDSSDKK